MVTFELVDILGKTVQEWEPQKIGPGLQRIKLNVNDHHSGIYLLKAKIGSENVVVRVQKA